MSPLKISLIAGFVAAIVTLGGHYRARQNLMRETSRLRAENDSLRFEASRRREALRAKIPASSDRQRAAVPSESGGTASSDTNKPGPGAEYRNEGQTTPVAALQTMAWASDRGDTGLMEKLVFFDRAAREKATAHLASLAPEVRAQWTSVEAMAASLLTSQGMHSPFPPAVILERAVIEAVDPNRVRLRLPDTNRELTEYQKTPEGWKFAITEAMVDNYLARPAKSEPAAK